MRENENKIVEIEKQIGNIENEEKDIKKRLEEFEMEEKKKTNYVREIEEKLLVFERKYEGSSEALEKHFASMIDVLKENYANKIEGLEGKYIGRIEELEDKLTYAISQIETKVTNIDNEKKKEGTAENKEARKAVSKTKEKFECQFCDYKANSKQGLSVHIKRKHTSFTEESLPNNCEICNEEFRDFEKKPWNKEKIENHVISHSYQCSSTLNYKCGECNFWGPNTITLELHIKKFHSERIICGLCKYEANDLEDLETHNTTCETYGCSECKNIFKSLPEIKNHTEKEHEGKKLWITHAGKDRQNPDFFDTKNYLSRELSNKNKK